MCSSFCQALKEQFQVKNFLFGDVSPRLFQQLQVKDEVNYSQTF